MRLLSEVGINRHIFPIIPKRGRIPKKKKYIEDVIKRKDKHGKVIFKATVDSKWNLRCYKFMDWLSSKIKYRFNYRMINPNPNLGIIKRLDDPRLHQMVLLNRPELIHEVLYGVKNPLSRQGDLATEYRYMIKLSCKKIAKDLKWMKSDVKSIIEMISKYKFITEYKMHTIKLNTSRTGQFKNSKPYIPDDFESLFNIEFDKDDVEINFNTGYGICFLHNIYTNGHQLVNNSLYKLSENTQFVYRNRFFTYGSLPKIYVRMDWVFNFLNITTTNVTNRKKIFTKIINELEEINEIQLKRKVNNECYEFSIGCAKKENKKDNNIIQLTPKIIDELKDVQEIFNREKQENSADENSMHEFLKSLRKKSLIRY